MVSALLFVVGVVAVFGLGEFKSFTPVVPKDRKKVNKNRIWLHLEPKCFDNQSDIRAFADHVVSKYECLTFREDRFRTFYRHYTSPNDTVWSVWLDRNHRHHANMACLDKEIRLPRDIPSTCIASVQYEPMEHVMQGQPTCKVHGTSGQLDLWSLDWLDGIFDSMYRYPDYTERANVEAIILDTDVDEFHVEFSDNDPNDLNEYYNGSPYGPSTSQDHGTHVAGTVVGHDVGGSWGVKLNYYAVCQMGGGCAWSDIERGYNWAIDYMNEKPGTRFVINYSVGGGRTASNEFDYNNWGIRIQAAGGIWVTSAGNSNADACNFAPAFSQYAVTVGAYDVNTQPAWFSNYGSCNDVWGPGVLVESAAPGGGYTKMSGTSMSSPNIAAIVAKLLKRDSTLDTERVKVYMMTNQRTVYGGATVGDMNQAYLNCDYD